jgi:plastocyanin
MPEQEEQAGEAPAKKRKARALMIKLEKLAKVASDLRQVMSAQPDLTCVIHVGEDGNFSFAPATLRASRKPPDTITWYCNQGEFALHFGARTPFHKTMLSSKGKQFTVTVHGQAALGSYRYVVAACVNQTVYVNACPEIIVEEPPQKEPG